MIVLGVTGGIGAGKSTLAERLARRGAEVVDADALVHELYRPGPVANEIGTRFGPSVLAPDGSVDRGKLAAVVFADEAARRALEGIVHPAVRRRILHEIETRRAAGFEGIFVVDAALLVEASPPYPLDALLVVVAPEEVRLGRLERKGLSPEEGRRRMRAQASDEAKRARADFVVVNDGSLETLDARLDDVLRALGRDTRTLLG
jgi:dephospho-CoA kinase